MTKPTDDFWVAAGLALIIFAGFAGFALVLWAVHP
jgi:hypothetical protein